MLRYEEGRRVVEMELRNMLDLWEEYVNIGKNNIKLNQLDVKKFYRFWKII